MSSRIEQMVQVAIGAATACWENLQGAGVFESSKALVICEELVTELEDLIHDRIMEDRKAQNAKNEAKAAMDHDPEDDMDKFRRELRKEMTRRMPSDARDDDGPRYENMADRGDLDEPVRDTEPVTDIKDLLDTDDAMVWAEEFCSAYLRRLDRISHGNERCMATNLIEPGWLVGWFANAIEVAKRINRDQEVKPVVEALRLTHEYVGAGMLPPVDGWDWYEVMKKHNPGYALKVRDQYHTGALNDDVAYEGVKYPDLGDDAYPQYGPLTPVESAADANRVWALNEAKSLLAERETSGLGARSRGASGVELVKLAEYILNGKERGEE